MPLLGTKAVEYNPFKLDFAPDQYNKQEMCDKAFEKSPESGIGICSLWVQY